MSLRGFLCFTGILIIEILIVVSMATGQNSVRINALDTKEFPSGKAYLSVLRNGIEPLHDLNSEDFTIYEDQVPINKPLIQLFKDSNEGVGIVVVFDSSGSVKGEALRNAKNAIKNFASELRPKDYIALISFNDNVKYASFRPDDESGTRFREFGNDGPVADIFTNDYKKFSKAVDEIKVGGKISVLYQAIVKAAQVVKNAETAYKCVFVLSDGHNEDPEFNDIDFCIKTIRELEVPVFAIGVGWQKSSWLEYMKRIGYETGAIYRHVSDPTKLDDTYHDLKQILMNQYVLSFRFGNTRRDGNIHKLMVSAKIDNREFLQQISFKMPLDTYREAAKSVPPSEKAGDALAGNPEPSYDVEAEIGNETSFAGEVSTPNPEQKELEKGNRRFTLYTSAGIASVIAVFLIYAICRIAGGFGGENKTKSNENINDDPHWVVDK